MRSPYILVTGATGTVGRHVAEGLADRGADAIATTRHPGEAADDLPLPTARFDFEDPSTYDVFEGVKKVFFVRPPAIARVWESICRGFYCAFEIHWSIRRLIS